MAGQTRAWLAGSTRTTPGRSDRQARSTGWLEVTQEHAGDGVARLAVAGEVDLATTATLQAAVRQAMQDEEVGAVHVDLDRVRLLAADGVDLLIRARRTAMDLGIAFRVLNAHGIVRRVLDPTGTSAVLLSVPHVDDAETAGFSGRSAPGHVGRGPGHRPASRLA